MKRLFALSALFGLSGCSMIELYYSPSIDLEDYKTTREFVKSELPEPFPFKLDKKFRVRYPGHIQRHNHLTDAVYDMCSRGGGSLQRDQLHFDTMAPENIPARTGIYSCYEGSDRKWSVAMFNSAPQYIEGEGFESTLHIDWLEDDAYEEQIIYHTEAAKSILSSSIFKEELFNQAALVPKEKGDQVCSFDNEFGEVLSLSSGVVVVDVIGQLVTDVSGDAISSPDSIKLAVEHRREKSGKTKDWAICFVNPKIINTKEL